MTELSESYQLARHIHDSFLGHNPDIHEHKIAVSGVKRKCNSDRPEIHIAGEDESGNRIRQTLSLGQNSVYYLRTLDDGGRTERGLRISRYSDLDRAELLTDSLFMRALVDIANRKVEETV